MILGLSIAVLLAGGFGFWIGRRQGYEGACDDVVGEIDRIFIREPKVRALTPGPMRVSIPVGCVEFDEGGNTIWVQGDHGTVLRIKTVGGKILTDECKTSPGSHGDVLTTGDIKLCIGTEDQTSED